MSLKSYSFFSGLAISSLNFCAVASILLLPQVTCAQNTSISVPLQRTTASKITLSDILEAYAKSHHTVVITELPLLTTNNVLSVSNIAGKPPETLDELNDVVRSLDYSVENRLHILILRRRYDVAGDVPDVSREECLQFLDGALSLIAPFQVISSRPVRPGTIPMVTNFYDLLSPSEKETLSTQRPRPIAMRDLPPAQQEALKQSCLYIYTGQTAAVWKQARETLVAAPAVYFTKRKATRLNNSSNNGVAALGYVAASEAKQEHFVPLMGGGLTVKTESVGMVKGLVRLGDVLQRISTAQNKSITTSTIIARKRLLVFGAIEDAPDKALDAVAALFGLEKTAFPEAATPPSSRPTGIVLSRPKAEPVSQPADLPAAIQKICPPALIRAMGAKPSINALSPIAVVDKRTQRQQQMKAYEKTVKESEARLTQLGTTISAGIKQSFDTYNQAATPAGNKPLPFKDLSEANQDAFAQYLLIEPLRLVRDRFTGSGPDYISKFDRLFFVGQTGKEGAQKDQTWFKMVLLTTDNAGNAVNALTLEGRVE